MQQLDNNNNPLKGLALPMEKKFEKYIKKIIISRDI